MNRPFLDRLALSASNTILHAIPLVNFLAIQKVVRCRPKCCPLIENDMNFFLNHNLDTLINIKTKKYLFFCVF
ncbi:hypothetical protein BpHYR1_033752 [Brachionus plicatilis]|uniref:Uncharacterized protein n=1 Tax=Brachionus plicatilis TaxID=10195 RepID=A0A3M7T2M0_BRAPC|nr:hypothetical protein BpHYR1_033752 [Brachionus plicatilis]